MNGINIETRDEREMESIQETVVEDKPFWLKKRDAGEDTIDQGVREKLEQFEIDTVELEGMKEQYQLRVCNAVESMIEEYPELRGFIKSVKVKDLPEGVYACAGPRVGKGGCYGEIQLSKEVFSSDNLEWKLVDAEIENFRGERWFAGRGIDGIVKHEMGHILHLQMIAEEVDLKLGEIDKDKINLLKEKYHYNSIAINICREAEQNLGISHNEVAKELSLYAATDYGEFFAEAISECETQKHPRRLAKEVYRIFKERYQNKEER